MNICAKSMLVAMILSVGALIGAASSNVVHAQAASGSLPVASTSTMPLSPSQTTVMKAIVLSVTSEENESGAYTGAAGIDQHLRAEILDGQEKGTIVSVENDHIPLASGDVFYLTHTIDPTQQIDIYAASDPYRLPWICGLVGLFVLCAIVFGGRQGMRGLIALALSLMAIAYVLFPSILHGSSPVLMSVVVASVMVVIGSYITHGFNKTTSAAIIGMVVTILITGSLALVSIHGAKLTGLSSDESLYLDINTGGSIDLAGLLLGGIIIGLLGVLYDAAISQAIAVEELSHAGPDLSRLDIFRRAIRMGREHIGALVNILAIAYVGASLPLLLLFYQSGADFALTINREIFATEIVRAMVGSIGLMLAVPITTLVAVALLMHARPRV
jgi:uncharacterized membrane protein